MTITQNWQQFFTRLDTDWKLIYKQLITIDEAYITNISVAGDTHCLGQYVMCLEFKGADNAQQSVIYKPRDMKIDLAYNELLYWYNKQDTLQLKTFRIFNRDDYGWCEFVTYESCDSLEAVERFYQRQGALLAILYCINGHDIHFENVIAHGEYPVIVDLECLLKPILAGQPLDYPPSVLESLLLPTRIDIEGVLEGWEIGGLDGSGEGKVIDAGLDFESTGTDEMTIKQVDVTIKNKSSNIPQHEGKPFQDDILAHDNVAIGFTKFYKIA